MELTKNGEVYIIDNESLCSEFKDSQFAKCYLGGFMNLQQALNSFLTSPNGHGSEYDDSEFEEILELVDLEMYQIRMQSKTKKEQRSIRGITKTETTMKELYGKLAYKRWMKKGMIEEVEGQKVLTKGGKKYLVEFEGNKIRVTELKT